MAFLTDKQTLDDLAIFGKPGTDSVFTLFNRTSTVGGAAVLEEMFTFPLSDERSIQDRLTILKGFTNLKIPFPFSADLFGFVEHYLENTDERTKLTHEHNTLGKRLSHLIDSDADYKVLQKGTSGLKEILIDLWNFLNSVSIEDGNSYSAEQGHLLLLLKEEPFLNLLRQKKTHTLSHAQVAEYDTLFRFRKRLVIKQMLQFIYKLDVYLAIAKTAAEKQFCFPIIDAGTRDRLKMDEVYHPLLKKPVANTIEISRDQNFIFLTGANMAGKSTLMKTLGISIFLAHAGLPVPARSMEFTVMDGLYTTINLSDNLGTGTSHFYAEVMRIKKVARELAIAKKLFVIFDELFRGTNVKDAYEATIAVISAFSQKRSSMFVVSTHIIEAGEVLKAKCNNLQFLYMPTRMHATTPFYPYVLEPGITNDRHGMIIIKNEGILEILTAKEKEVEHELHNG
jgi:DNA mismatch repair ATPase MutS